MELINQLCLIISICSSKITDNELQCWANRFIFGIDRTEVTFDVVFSKFRFENLNKTWLSIFIAVRAWYDTFRPNRSDEFKQEGHDTCLKYLDLIAKSEEIPEEYYKL